MNRTAMVTGGCGFIGANLVPALLSRGYRVKVLDNLSTGNRNFLKDLDVEIIEGDIRDTGLLERALRNVHDVVHLAAFGSVIMSIQNPVENFSVNAEGTFRVLNACAHHGIEKVVFASTGGALIGAAPPPVDEMSVPRPISPYGASKACGEAYCYAMAGAYGLNTVALRFANIYGPQSWHKKGAVTAFAKAILSRQPVTIYGDGRASRDLMHVSDLCTGIIQAVETQLPAGEVMHLASGVETTIGNLAKMLVEISGSTETPIIHKPARIGEVERNFASSRKAAKLLNFEPEIPIREGLERTWAWFVNNQDT